MNKISSMLYFHFFTLVKAPKFIIPLGVLILLQFIHYSTVTSPPTDYFNYIFLSEIFTFIVAIWLGYISHHFIDETTEQLLILRLRSHIKYYTIRTVFLFLISTSLALISVSIPAIFNFTGLFYQFTPAYFIYSFLIFLGSSFAGVSLGALFHPRVVPQKAEAPILAIFIALIAVTRYPITQAYPFLTPILWLLPNTSAHHALIPDSTHLTLMTVAFILLTSLAYGFFYSVINIYLLTKNKF